MKGLMLIIQAIASFFMKIKAFIPPGLIGVFVITTFVVNASTQGVPFALLAVAKTLLAAETTIHEKVDLAIANDPSYSFPDLFAIVISVIILWRIISFLTDHVFVGLAGAQSRYGAMMGAVLVLAIIEWAVVGIVDKDFTFIPIWHGLIYLLINFGPVINNLHFFGKQIFPRPIAGITNKSINLTHQ